MAAEARVFPGHVTEACDVADVLAMACDAATRRTSNLACADAAGGTMISVVTDVAYTATRCLLDALRAAAAGDPTNLDVVIGSRFVAPEVLWRDRLGGRSRPVAPEVVWRDRPGRISMPDIRYWQSARFA